MSNSWIHVWNLVHDSNGSQHLLRLARVQAARAGQSGWCMSSENGGEPGSKRWAEPWRWEEREKRKAGRSLTGNKSGVKGGYVRLRMRKREKRGKILRGESAKTGREKWRWESWWNFKDMQIKESATSAGWSPTVVDQTPNTEWRSLNYFLMMAWLHGTRGTMSRAQWRSRWGVRVMPFQSQPATVSLKPPWLISNKTCGSSGTQQFRVKLQCLWELQIPTSEATEPLSRIQRQQFSRDVQSWATTAKPPTVPGPPGTPVQVSRCVALRTEPRICMLLTSKLWFIFLPDAF